MAWTIKVEIALGANLTNFSSWSWTDITTFVRFTPPVTITRGRPDEFSTAPPSRCTLWLDNRDGRFFPRNPVGAYYGQVQRNTPLRVRVDPGTGYVTRFTGFVDEWPPVWDPSYRERHVEVTASGVLRRLQQGAAERSALYRANAIQAYSTSPRPVGYWPCEDPSGSLRIASGVGGPPAAFSGMTLGGDSNVDGSDPLMTLTTVGAFTGLVPAYPTTAQWKVSFLTRLPSAPAAAVGLMGWQTPGGSPSLWRMAVYPGAPDRLKLEAYTSAGEVLGDTGVDVETLQGGLYSKQLYVEVTAVQNGTAVDWQYYVYHVAGAISSGGSVAASTLGNVEKVTVIGTNLFDGATLGHIAVSDSTAFGPNFMGATGFGDETPDIRFARLAVEEDLGAVTPTASSSVLGAQAKVPVVQLYQELEAAESGVLYERTDGKLALLTRPARENLPVTWTLDFTSGHINGWTVTDDDQKLRNDVEVASAAGTSARFFDLTSIAAEGHYDERLNLNLWQTEDPYQYASWRVRLGTVAEARYPGITVHLHRSTTEIAEWLACDIGSRVTVANPPPGSPPDLVDLHLEGYTETITRKTWTVVLNTSPAQPWQVGTVAAGLDADSATSYLLDGVTSSATTMRVARSGIEPPWTTTVLPDDVGVGGEQVTVTAVATNAASFVAAGTAAHADNASVTPGMPASVQQGDLLLVLAAIRNTAASVTTPAGYTQISFQGSNFALYGKIHTGVESAPTVSFTGGSAGDTCSAQMAAFRNVQLLKVGGSTGANAAQQDIAVGVATGPYRGNCLAVICGWKQDDWTSVATIAGATEIGEPSSTLGNDQGICWDYLVQTNGADVPGTSFVVTGGAAAIGKAFVAFLAGDVQTFTVTRAVNTVSKAQTAGTAVSLWKPLAVAL